jgi:hypothetical protein
VQNAVKEEGNLIRSVLKANSGEIKFKAVSVIAILNAKNIIQFYQAVLKTKSQIR